MKKTLLLAAILAVTLSVPAFAADNGDTSSDTTSTSTNSNGTTTTNESKQSVDNGSNGDYTKKSETTSKTDPKGLMNSSSKTSTKNVTRKKGHKVTTEHTQKVNGDTTEDTKTESDTSGQ